LFKRTRKRVLGFVVAWFAALAIFVLRHSCRIRWINDPRSELRARGQRYLYCVLHAHQVMATMDAEPGTGAMVSQSADGDIIALALKFRGIRVLRGSNANDRGDRGGRGALETLRDHVDSGRPVCLAVDGPRGPRGRVHKGIAYLAQQTGAVVIVVVPTASRRWILRNTWDRMQIPWPFCRVDGHCAAPLQMAPGEKLNEFRQRIEHTILELERQLDPAEARYSRPGGRRGKQHAGDPSATATGAAA
jgi:lysophospholipid acyltransferase (LPLAT)-like uncharacterized protein